MRVRLIDIDNKYREPRRRGHRFPNLALMKWSAYYKARGDLVAFDLPDPDITVMACVFPRNYPHALREATLATTPLTWGGTGIPLTDQYRGLPEPIEILKPDYDLYRAIYPSSPFCNSTMGFTSRGCIRDCEFCIVRQKEGAFRRHQAIADFHDPRHKIVTLLDNNILADRDWFFEQTDWCIDRRLQLNISQGMDIRLLTPEIAAQLKRIRFVDGQMRFAWDILAIEPHVENGIRMLREAGINVRRNVSFFVLAGYHRPGEDPAPFCQDLYRCNRLHEMGARAYVMPYNEEGSPLVRALARWANRPTLRNTPFWKYDRLPGVES